MALFRREPSGVRMSVSASTDVGQTRDHNEDRFLVADLTSGERREGSDEDEFPLGLKGALLLVADGMGGAMAGEVASGMAADIIFDHLTVTWSSNEDSTPARFADCIRDAVQRANAEIHAEARARLELQGMGTTATVVGVLGQHFLFSQVGDSRAYLIREGEISQLTKDQSFVQHLLDTGRVTAEEAAEMPQRNLILQAVGPNPTVEVVQSWRPIARGDTVLLCSDGLTEMIGPDQIREIVTGSADLSGACEGLIALANSNGGVDNITVVVARLTGSELQPPEELGGDEVSQ